MASTTAEIVAEIAKIKNNHTILNGFENTHHKVHQKENEPSTMGKRKSLYLPRTLPRHANLRRHSALRLEKSAIWLFVSKDKMIVDFLNKKEFFFFRKRPVDFSLNYCTILLILEHFSKVSIMCITHFETKKNILSKNWFHKFILVFITWQRRIFVWIFPFIKWQQFECQLFEKLSKTWQNFFIGKSEKSGSSCIRRCHSEWINWRCSRFLV